jgi:FkbM family methyltransferase
MARFYGTAHSSRVRLEDLRDWLALRKIARNPWQVVRFRKSHREGDVLQVKLRDAAPLELRGGRADFHMFHRIFLRDEYRLRSAVPALLDCVVDLGANVGLFSARIAPSARRVIAYEPYPAHFAQLVKNTAGRTNVENVQAAVAGKSGTVRLYEPVNAGQSGTHSLHAESGGYMSQRFVDVPALSLDELFARHALDACDLLKLDVEGSEYEILYGASAATLARVRRIHGEYHDVGREDPRTRTAAFTRFLREAGFEVEVVPHRRKDNHGNFFAVRPDARAPAAAHA